MQIQVSANFKKMTTVAIVSIAIFILVYLLLIVFAIALTIACAFAGISLIIAVPKFITIALGLGLASLGFLVLIFLFKFLFKKHTTDLSDLVEITANDEPKLFAFIHEIVKEVKTDFPKKIYLSSEVNASVFYDSSFWSMFLPIRKNLQIGMALVNSVTEQEFKAILAHEFGHFSQKSMKVGSYVYNVNQVIFNMLYDNESYDEMIKGWANVSNYFSIFVFIAVKIINAIQWVLKKMYAFVNISYMALSREMEFHADEVAANVAGYLPLKESLMRLELANKSYNSVLNFYGKKIEENFKSPNIYKEHQFVMKFFATEENIPLKNNLPLVNENFIKKYNKSKLNIKDQWASHPSLEERVTALEKLNIIKEYPNENSASSLFTNVLQVEEMITEKMFAKVQYQNAVSNFDEKLFQQEFLTSYSYIKFPKEYNGYYDYKNPSIIELNIVQETDKSENIEELFSLEKVNWVYESIAFTNDINDLNQIINKNIVVKTFDYDGKKYNYNEAEFLINKLQEEKNIISNKIIENDKNIYHYFLNKAHLLGKTSELNQKYSSFFKEDANYDDRISMYNKLDEASSFISVSTPFEEIEINLKNIAHQEIEFKKEIKKLLEYKILEKEITSEIKESIDKYLNKDWIYFSNHEYDNEALKLFFDALNNFKYLNSQNYLLHKLDLLKFQISLN
jgi:Zn-dependent protease with chaperone function